jgi:hypothetical protein
MNFRDDIFFIAFFFLMLGLGIFSFFWQFGRSRRMLEQWAGDQGYRLTDAEYRWFARGPFFWTSSKGQTVYRIAVVTPEGFRHTGWARCGGWFFGLLSRKVTVKWDNPPPGATRGFPVIPLG